MTDLEKTSLNIRPSKTIKKKIALNQQELGRKLSKLKESDLAKIELDERLLRALIEHKRLGNSHGAQKRQLQYIGKLMRDFDFDKLQHSFEAIKTAPKKFKHEEAVEEIQKNVVNRILKEGESAIHQVVQAYPILDRKQLRHLWRNWKRTPLEKQEIHKKKLAKYLRLNL